MAYTADLTATMTTYTSPSPNQVLYSVDYPGYEAWKAFDKSTAPWNSGWWYNYPEGAGGWICYDFGAGNEVAITKFTLYQSLLTYPFWTDAYSFYGSNDTTNGSDGSWTLLLSVTGILLADTGSTDTTEVRTFSNTTAYRYYKIVSDHATGGDFCFVVRELTLHSDVTGPLTDIVYNTTANLLTPSTPSKTPLKGVDYDALYLIADALPSENDDII